MDRLARSALVIGVNKYDGDDELFGSVPDALAMYEMLRRNGDDRRSNNWTVKVVVDDKDVVEAARLSGTVGVTCSVDGATLRSVIRRHLEHTPATHVLLYYAGHARVDDTGDGELVGVDGVGYRFADLLELTRTTPARTVTILLDCCHAGAAGNVHDDDLEDPFKLPSVQLREGVTVLSACRSVERAGEAASADGSVRGAFTRLLLSGLGGAASDALGNITAFSLYAHALGASKLGEQIPLIKSHVVIPTQVRSVQSRIDTTRLRALIENRFFPHMDSVIELDMRYEGGGDWPGRARGADDYVPFAGPHNGQTQEQTDLDYLKEWRDAGLVTSSKDFYFSCLNGGYVELTEYGKYFWQLAAEDLL